MTRPTFIARLTGANAAGRAALAATPAPDFTTRHEDSIERATKAWNSAVRSTEAMARAVARHRRDPLTGGRATVEHPDGLPTYTRTWTGESGASFTATVTQQKED